MSAPLVVLRATQALAWHETERRSRLGWLRYVDGLPSLTMRMIARDDYDLAVDGRLDEVAS